MSASATWHDNQTPANAATRKRAFAAARRHSRRVRVLRVLLPMAGIGAVAGLVVLTQIGLPLDLDLTAARLSITPNAVIMENPNLTGFDSDQREYTVAAERAIQSLANPDQVRLEAIEATIAGDPSGTTKVTAETGQYDHSQRTLRLEGDVSVNSAEGYALRMKDVQVDFVAGTMQTDNPITVIYADSEVTSQSFQATDGGKRLLFGGGVRTTIMPPKRETASTGGGEDEKPGGEVVP